MRIGLVLAYKGVNYGMLLQAFATQEVIHMLGYDTEIIDYKRTDFKHIRKTPYLLWHLIEEFGRKRKLKTRNANQLQYDEIHKKNLSERKAVSNVFIKEKLQNQKKISGIIDLENYAKGLNGVLVGSDQLWAPDAVFGNFATLRFVPDYINKISYATSLGVAEYPFYCKSSAANFLKRINHISVREEQGKKIIEGLCDSSVQVVLDPTYLLTKEEWNRLIPEERIIDGKYVLCYFLGGTEKHKQLARDYADKHGLKLIAILSTESVSGIDTSYADLVITGYGPEKFLNLIRGAACVMTDSFHGLAFSIINNKQFYVFYRTKVGSKNSRNSRIDNILDTWNLQSRLILDDDSIDNLDNNPINYNRVNKILEIKRADSLEFLKTALKDCK